MVADLSAGAPCTLDTQDWTQKVCDRVPLVRCGEPAIAVITFACVHEHVDRALACVACVAEAQRADGLLICPCCEDGPEPHECKVAMEIRWLCDAATTRGSEDG
jgi:hypothetical protein